MMKVASLAGVEADARKARGEQLDAASKDLEARLDEALRETFPASDPIAVSGEGDQQP
jgi:hypothetical protein